jgi:hypothetical protein
VIKDLMKLRTVSPLLLVCLAAAFMPAARADYAVLRSGERLHITGYERVDDRFRLTVDGGSLEIAADDLVAFEPEDTFQAFPAPPPESTAPYVRFIREAATKHGVDEKLITRVIAMESNFNPKAISVKKAQGLMQLMPHTAARYQVKDVFDPAQNIDGGTHYLKDLLAKYQGNISLALAAYNAGPDMVEKYRGVPPFPETQNYVRLILSTLAK